MPTVLRQMGLTPRSVATVLALALGTVGLLALVPAPAHAVLPIIFTHYYSDGTLTHQVGECIENTCAHTDTCSGQMTSFVKVTTGICH